MRQGALQLMPRVIDIGHFYMSDVISICGQRSVKVFLRYSTSGTMCDMPSHIGLLGRRELPILFEEERFFDVVTIHDLR